MALRRGKLSCLLAVFQDTFSNEAQTLLHILWEHDDEVRRILAIRAGDFSLKSLEIANKPPRDIKKHLETAGWTTYDSFKEYEARVCRILRVPPETGFRLLNQAVAVKDVGSITGFVRNHMLARPDRSPLDHLEAIKQQYRDLISLHEEILRVKQQLEDLAPLPDLAKVYREQKANVERLEKHLRAGHAHYYEERVRLLTAHLAEEEKNLTVQKARGEELKTAALAMRDELGQIEQALAQDSVEQRKKELARLIAECDRALKERTEARRDFMALLSVAVPGQTVDTPADFTKVQVASAAVAVRRNEQATAAVQRATRLEDERVKLTNERAHLAEEIASLRAHPSKIPQAQQRVREGLCATTGINPAAVPFVGELLELAQGEEEWRGAIELILRGFSLSMLVSERDYPVASSYLEKESRRLGLRLYYHMVPAAAGLEPPVPAGPRKLPTKLMIKQDSPFRSWVSRELLRSFDYTCVDSLNELQQTSLALLRSGHARYGSHRHGVGQNYDLTDPRNHFIGWDNTRKIDAVLALAVKAEARNSAIASELTTVNKERTDHELVRSKAEGVARYRTFGEIDAESEARRLAGHTKEMQALEEAEDKNRPLREQKKALVRKLGLQDEEIKKANGAEAIAEKEIQTSRTRLTELGRDRAPGWPEGGREMVPEILKQHQTEKITHQNIDFIAPKVIQRIQGSLNNYAGFMRNAAGDIERCMSAYLSKPDRGSLKNDLHDKIEYLEQFEQHRAALERDGLPPLVSRYRELMRDKLQVGISSFRMELDNAEASIETRIRDLNHTLRTIKFTPDTYIQLRYRSSSDQDVHTFNAQLKECLHGVQTPVAQVTDDDRERVFAAIRKLIAWGEENPGRYEKAADPRFAKQFNCEELWARDDTHRFRYDDSQGKSGGEKAKLAYTILASAIAFQYKLKPGLASDGFRMVIVDEMFSKVDEANSRFALDLFKQFDLQLIMVMPMSSDLQMVAPYARSFHVVDARENRENGQRTSHVLSVTAEEYRERVQNANPDAAT
jgi:uncharacterized protein YPO0396